jgi:hypothetical protein
VARPTKTLQEHLRHGSFRADRHAGLLLGPLVDDPDLAGLQATYRRAASTDEQRLIAIAFAQEAKLHEGRKPRPILSSAAGAIVEWDRLSHGFAVDSVGALSGGGAVALRKRMSGRWTGFGFDLRGQR